MIGVVANDPARFGVEENKLRMVTRMLQTIEGTVLDGQIFEVRWPGTRRTTAPFFLSGRRS